MTGKQDASLSKRHSTRHAVLQFPDIAGPIVTQKFVQSPTTQVYGRLVLTLSGFCQEVVDEERKIFLALPQGWGADGDDCQPVIEIFPECAVFNAFQQVDIGCGNDPRIEGYVLVAAQGTDMADGQGSEQGLLDLW